MPNHRISADYGSRSIGQIHQDWADFVGYDCSASEAADICKLAEENYHSWKENPWNPGLRFKQIYQSLPIFSFRVGMRHRTVGVETGDGKIVWFWVGSFETFRQAVGA